MPLRITNGIPINPQPEPQPAPQPEPPGAGGGGEEIILDAEIQPSAQPAAEHPNPLNIPPIPQKARLWCWAACMEMVLNSNGNFAQPEKQCSIIAKIPELNAADCCGQEEVFADKSLSAKKVAEVWRSPTFGIQAEERLEPPRGEGQIPFEMVKAEISAGRPIEVAVRWFEGGSHALLIKGFGEIGGRPSVWINDPLMTKSLFSAADLHTGNGGEGQILFSELRKANNYGRWVGTWTGLQK
ncbi:MAG: C39 family peptidase [Acidobacteria bacterium]|nr:C39 family peptidase [Acidobacteriota bacterium]